MRSIDKTTIDILKNWSQGKKPTELEQDELVARELANFTHAHSFGITRDNCEKLIEARSQFFCSVYQETFDWCCSQGLQDEIKVFSLLWGLWLPLAVNLAETRQKLGRTPIQGILGGQGTGKSTLAQVLQRLLDHLDYTTANFSLDDLYKTYTERYKLQKNDPRLIWRGPPGTHDVYLGIQVLEQCLQPECNEPILIPRFDKSLYNGMGDRIKPEAIPKADIVIFEGWFVGVRPIDNKIFDTPIPPIETVQDIQFAKDNNERLKAYLPLWDKLDRLLVLYPKDYRYSKQWRKEAEHKMIASGKTGMRDDQIDDFVDYFWRALHPKLFITPLIKNPDLVDLVIEIDSDRTYDRIYKPGTDI